MVIILLAYSLTLEGADIGIHAYIGTVDTSHLSNGQAWVDAAGQIFYGLSLAVGCMIAYGSQQKQDKPVNFSTFFVSITNSVYSFIGGFAMFAVMGYLANDMGVAHFNEMSGNVGGFMLSFVSFPTAIALLPSGVSHFFAIFFFLFLLLLGLDSSMALVEACTVTLRDQVPFFSNRPAAAAGAVVTVAFVVGLTFCTQGGEAAMDIMDHFTSNYCLLLVGLFECVSVWVYEFAGAEEGRVPLKEQSWRDVLFSSRLEKEMEKITGTSMKYLPFVWSFHVKFIVPLIIGGLFVIMVSEDAAAPYGGYPQWANLVFGWIFCVVIPMGCVFIGSFFQLRLADTVHQVAPRKDSVVSERQAGPITSTSMV